MLRILYCSVQTVNCVFIAPVSAGKLVTVFSAPDYPQHQAGDERFNNKASVLTLNYPSYSDSDYEVTQYSAVERPPAPCFYDLDIPGSDDELNIGADGLASDVSEGFASSAVSTANGSEVDDGRGKMDTEEVTGSLQNGPEHEPVANYCPMDLAPCPSTAAVQNHSTPTPTDVVKAICMVEAVQLQQTGPNSYASAKASVEAPKESEAVVEDGNQGGIDEPVELEERSVGCKTDMSSAAIACHSEAGCA